MAEYSRVQNRIWNSRTFKRLSEDGKYLWLYLLTCPHGNLLGLFVLKAGYVQEDLEWSSQRFTKAFDELLSIPLSNGCRGLIKYDPDNKLLLIKNYLEHNPLENPNQVKAAIKKLSNLPDSELFKDLKLFVEQFNKQFYQPLAERLGKPVTVTVAEPVTETVTLGTVPPCPYEEIQKIWNEEMVPEDLPRVRVFGSNRRKHLNARWKELKERQSLNWWSNLFRYIKKRDGNGKYINPFLMGKIEPTPGKKRFLLTLPWLVANEENLSKVHEGFYEERD